MESVLINGHQSMSACRAAMRAAYCEARRAQVIRVKHKEGARAGKPRAHTHFEVQHIRALLAYCCSDLRREISDSSPTIRDTGQKIGRWMRSRVTDCPDHVITWLCDYIRSTWYSPAGQYVRVESGGIAAAYRAADVHTHSCMTTRSHVSMLDLSGNRHLVSLATWQDGDGEIRARRLLWHLDETYADRLYSSTGVWGNLLDKAIERGFPGVRFRIGNSLPDGTIKYRTPEGKTVVPSPIMLHHKGTFPYMDTFHYVTDLCDDTIELTARHDQDHEYELSSVDGDTEPATGCTCYGCDSRIERDEAYHVDGYDYCSDCVHHCDYCDEYAPADEVSYSNHLEVSYCDGCRERHHDQLIETD